MPGVRQAKNKICYSFRRNTGNGGSHY